jgi:hypothetical protein
MLLVYLKIKEFIKPILLAMIYIDPYCSTVERRRLFLVYHALKASLCLVKFIAMGRAYATNEAIKN